MKHQKQASRRTSTQMFPLIEKYNLGGQTKKGILQGT